MPGQVTVLPSQYSVKYGSASPALHKGVEQLGGQPPMTANTVRPLTYAWSYPGEPVMLKLYPRLGYHSVQMRFSARLTWAMMLALQGLFRPGKRTATKWHCNGPRKCYTLIQIV